LKKFAKQTFSKFIWVLRKRKALYIFMGEVKYFMEEFVYIGTELELFAQAQNWKAYIKQYLQKYIQGNVLEVGAGIGSNTGLLYNPQCQQWLCLEPDRHLFTSLQMTISSLCLPNCQAKNGTITLLEQSQKFDAILYLDVLEHILDDRKEVLQVLEHLTIGGYLIILCPAHQWLFSPFDTAVGHYRRYNKNSLRSLMPNNLQIVDLVYLDCIGLLANLGNRLLLKQSKPNPTQIKIWDRYMVSLSRICDRLIGYSVGKSVILIGKKI
jgi:protein-L-isoaspartate O-methyltransferase